MINNRFYQAGSHHVILVGAVIVGLLGLLGYVGYNSWQRQSADAGSQSTLGRTKSNVSNAQKTINKLESQLKTDVKKRTVAKEKLERIKGYRDSILSGTTSNSENEKFAVSTRNLTLAKKAYTTALKKAKNKKSNPAVKKAKAKLNKAQSLYDSALVLRETRSAYIKKRNTESKSEPTASLRADVIAARNQLKASDKKVAQAEKVYMKNEKLYKKKSTSAAKKKLAAAKKALTSAEKANLLAQDKVSTVFDAYEKQASTWPEYVAFVAAREPLQNLRQKVKDARDSLNKYRRAVEITRSKIDTARNKLSVAKKAYAKAKKAAAAKSKKNKSGSSNPTPQTPVKDDSKGQTRKSCASGQVSGYSACIATYTAWANSGKKYSCNTEQFTPTSSITNCKQKQTRRMYFESTSAVSGIGYRTQTKVITTKTYNRT